jgi:predicted CoA-binding protein
MRLICLESLFTTTAFFSQILKGERLKEKPLVFNSHCSLLSPCGFAALGGTAKMNTTFNKIRPLFEPQSIAFIGATSNRNKWGNLILSQILYNRYKGRVYAVNPTERESILGLEPFPNVSATPESPGLAVIVTPQAMVPDIVRECVRKRAKACLVITRICRTCTKRRGRNRAGNSRNSKKWEHGINRTQQ